MVTSKQRMPCVDTEEWPPDTSLARCGEAPEEARADPQVNPKRRDRP
jgi:hypothetical protein